METTTVETYLLLGSNDGERFDMLVKAKTLLRERVGSIVSVSSVYETEAWGMNNVQAFLNQIVRLSTVLAPLPLLKTLLEIEEEMGRTRPARPSGHYTSRIIDIDILYYGALCVQEKTLSIPHPRIAERRFVLVPMVELNAGMLHPMLKKTQEQMLSECPDQLEVKKLNG